MTINQFDSNMKKLPQKAYVANTIQCSGPNGTPPVIAIIRGDDGFYPIYTNSTADALNHRLGVTPEQASAMKNGSMFGWNTASANPDDSINLPICWSCKVRYSSKQRLDADGNCPHCGVEIQLGEPDENKADLKFVEGETLGVSGGVPLQVMPSSTTIEDVQEALQDVQNCIKDEAAISKAKGLIDKLVAMSNIEMLLATDGDGYIIEGAMQTGFEMIDNNGELFAVHGNDVIKYVKLQRQYGADLKAGLESNGCSIATDLRGVVWVRNDRAEQLEKELSKLRAQMLAMDPIIELVLDVVRLAYDAMENTGEDDIGKFWDNTNFDDLSKAMDKLEALPDDRPGYVMGPAAKVAWAFRDRSKDQA